MITTVVASSFLVLLVFLTLLIFLVPVGVALSRFALLSIMSWRFVSFWGGRCVVVWSHQSRIFAQIVLRLSRRSALGLFGGLLLTLFALSLLFLLRLSESLLFLLASLFLFG